MQTDNKIKEPGTTGHRLASFVENDLHRELCRMRADFREPLRQWFTKTRDEVQRLRKDDELHYKYTIDILSSNLSDLDGVIDELSQIGWHLRYREAVAESCSGLPEWIEEKQSGRQFEKNESDGIRAKIVKLCKRAWRTVSKKPFTRKIYVKQLAADHFLQSNDWIANFAAREYDELAMLIELLLEKTRDTSAEVPDEGKSESHSTFQLEILLEFEDHLQVAIQHLKQFDENNESQTAQLLADMKRELAEKAEKAGTFELMQKVHSATDKIDFRESTADQLEKQKNIWIKFLRSQYTDLRVQSEIARYGFIASSVKGDILQQSHDFFRDTFYLPIEKGIETIKRAVEEVRKISGGSSRGFDKKLDRIRLNLQEELIENLIEPMQDEQDLMLPVKRVQNLISDLQIETRRFSEELTLAKKRESKYPLPELQMDTIRWQSLAARFLKEEAFKKLDPSHQKLDDLLNSTLKEVEEAVQVTDVNILAAIESGESDQQDNPLQIALDGLERAVNTLEKSIREVRHKQNAYQAVVKKTLPNAMHSLAKTMLNRDFDRFEMQDKALMVKEQAINWQLKLVSKWAVFSEKVELTWRFLILKFRTKTRSVKPYLGFDRDGVVSEKEKRNLAEYLSKPGVESDLPFIYKRLFDRDFSIDERFYVAPKYSMETIGNSYAQWKKGLGANAAIVGEKGSGKTTMIGFACREILGDTKPVVVDFDNTFTEEKELLRTLCVALGFKITDCREEFLEKVERKRGSEVIVVENLQNIFIRNMNGYGALEAFWVIMSATMDKLFWIVSCSRYSWNFFMKMSSADQYFSHVVFADQLDEDEIREAILARHKSTGYELQFEPGESLKNSRAYKKVMGDIKQSQELIRDNYFSRLAKICEGNTSIAMIFWLQSIKEFDSQKFVFRPLEVTEVDKLEVPSKEVLFTLAALVIHDTLNNEEVAMALHEDLSQSRLMLARLKTKGIVYASKSGYNLNHLVYRQVVRLLKRRNIIH